MPMDKKLQAGNDANDDDALNGQAEANDETQRDYRNVEMSKKGDTPGAVGYRRNQYPGRPKPVRVDRTMMAGNFANNDDALIDQVEEYDQPRAVGYRRNAYPGRPKPASVPVDRTMLAWNYGNDDEALSDQAEENDQTQPECSRDEDMCEKEDRPRAVGYRRNENSDQVITNQGRSGGKWENRGPSPEQNRPGHASCYQSHRDMRGRGGKSETVGHGKNEKPGRVKTGNDRPTSYDATSSDEEDEKTVQHPDFEFFWLKKSPFSQWYQKYFFVGDHEFVTAEQYMMYQKAVIFQDFETAEKILKESNPRKQQKLGRQVRNFNPEKWKEVCVGIVKTANFQKFSQNEDLKNYLFSTYPRTLVNASPYDRIWGIGRVASDPKSHKKETWLGHNLLGYALTDVRNKMMIKEKIIPACAPTFLAETALIDTKSLYEVERFV